MCKFGFNVAFFILLCVLASPGHSAGFSAKSGDPVTPLLKQADAHFKGEYYYQASFFYEKAVALAPNHTYAHYQLAECYRKLFHYESAKPHFKTVYESEKDKYPLAGYYLALMHKLTGDYVESVQYFEAFLEYAQQHRFSERTFFVQQAQLEKEGSLYALEDTMKPKGRFAFTRLPVPVNTKYNDYAPAIYLSDSCLLITSTRPPGKNSAIDNQYGEFFSDHYLLCKSNDTGWEEKRNPGNFSILNTKFSEGSGFFHKQSNTFFFTGCYQEGYCHIYQSTLENNEWQKPTPLGKEINLNGYESKQPSLTASGDTLFFVSNREGGYGGQDLWMSIRSENKNWQHPINLGASVNTPQNEVAPFYYPDENLLFFASNGHQGFGGFDLFMANTAEAAPDLALINLGPPFNSYKDDLYISLGDKKGYLSSNRDNSAGDFDIYSFDITSSRAVLLSVQNNGANVLSLNKYFEVLRFFSEQDQQYFKQLPAEEKTKVKRYIEVRAFRGIAAEKASLNEDLVAYYEQLPSEEKEFIDRLVTARKNMLLRENENVLLAEDEYRYQQLSTEKKEKIGRIVEARFYQKILQENADNFEALQLYFESLPTEEQARIQRTFDESEKFAAKNYQDEASLEDLFFFSALPTEEKQAIERSMDAILFSQKNAGQAGLNEEDQRHLYEQLPLEAQEQVRRIVEARQFALVTAQDQSKVAGMATTNGLDIGVLAIGNPNNISIEGKITRQGKPAGAVKVGLMSENGQSEKLATTNSEGYFKFFDVDYHQDQKIFFGEQDVKFTQLARFTMEELKITVLQDSIVKQTFDNIYFETNQFAIPNEVFPILDSLADFHKKYADVQIEISAYADTVGSETYNLQLSQKRAQAAYQYLIKNGVDPTALHIYGKGKEIPKNGQDLRYSRRVEFELQGVATSYNPTREVYVVQAQPNLIEIAKKYGITMKTLQSLNPNISDTPSPFTPVRILANEY